jgi:AcrR family transcriptional regulator
VNRSRSQRKAGQGPSAKRQHQRAVLGRLLEAARELFLAEGVEAVTVRRIARRAGCSIGLLYHYADSKEDLLARILARTFARLLYRLRRQSRSHSDPQERLHAVLASYVRFGLKHPHDYQLLFLPGTSAAHPHLRRVFHTLGIACYRVIRDCCTDCIQNGRFRSELGDADVAAQVLWAGAHGLVHLFDAAQGFPFRPRSVLLRCHIETLVAGVLRP